MKFLPVIISFLPSLVNASGFASPSHICQFKADWTPIYGVVAPVVTVSVVDIFENPHSVEQFADVAEEYSIQPQATAEFVAAHGGLFTKTQMLNGASVMPEDAATMRFEVLESTNGFHQTFRVYADGTGYWDVKKATFLGGNDRAHLGERGYPEELAYTGYYDRSWTDYLTTKNAPKLPVSIIGTCEEKN